MSEKKPRRELTAAQADLIEDLLVNQLPGGIGAHPAELLELETVYLVMSNLCRRAAEKHQGLEPNWKQFCEAALLPPAVNQLCRTQDIIERLLGPLGIDLVRQDNQRKGAALPGFRVANAGTWNKEEELPDEAGEPEDLTVLDGEMVNAGSWESRNL
jgi:hypothetical protein